MNKKLLLILIPVLLLSTVGISVKTYASPADIKIGLIGPQLLSQWEPAGMLPAAEMAIKEINDAGGVNVGGDHRNFTLIPANEWAYDPSTGTYSVPKATASINALLGAGAQFIIGGFRTEVTQPIIEEVMDWNEDPEKTPVPFFICGASTDELLPNMSIPANYARYKWLFRVTPVNSTLLFKNICGYLGGYLIPKKLAPMYCNDTYPPEHPGKFKFAVVVEDLTWTVGIGNALMYMYSVLLGPNVTTSTDLYFRVPTTTTDFTSVLNQISAAGVHLIVTAFTLPMANNLIQQWHTLQTPAIIVGINVQGQLQIHPDDCNFKYEYECMLNFAGTNTSIVPGKTEVFWTNFMSYTESKYPSGHPYYRLGGWWPIYTAWGAYDAIYALKEAIESAGTTDPTTLIPVFEATNRVGLANRFKYTSWHDVYTQSYGPLWPDDYTRAMMVQWINESLFTPGGTKGYMSVVSPVDKPYSHKTLIPPWMYDLAAWDLNFDGTVDMKDVRGAAKAFGAGYGDTRWNIEADINLDNTIDMKDIRAIAKNFGKTAPKWPL
jgi:branched-chain amino acid transport system substrate-binding protein